MAEQFMLVTVSGADRIGIVRDVAEAVAHLAINIEDSSMTALRGEFTIMMIIRLPEGMADGVGQTVVKAALADLEQKSGLVIQSRALAGTQVELVTPEPNCVVTVAGGDRPGIVHAVAAALAAANASIVDLSTTVQSEQYLMALEVAVASVTELQAVMARSASTLAVEIEVIAMDEALL
ncbi:MAG: ACT domain-containing protein [Mariprofundales bacterium]|nr:ACT domain-containing protein [Mariprofundales bacterium]